MSQLPDSRLLLEAMMMGISDEVYLIDAASMQLVRASDSVLKNTGCNLEGLKELSLDSLLGVSKQTLHVHVSCHRDQTHFVELLQDQAPLTGIINNDQLMVMLLSSGGHEFILIIKSDFSSKEEAMRALNESESRFQAIVSNTPGLVFQFQLDTDGEITFVYLSEGCKALLGLSADELKRDPTLFYAMMNARDRTSLRRRLERSTIELSLLNWEGRVWIDDWQDTKWINVRSIPRVLNNGVIQWEGIMTNITQSKNEKHEIEQSRRDLAELSAHMNHIKEQERSAIAREIHDDLGGNLTAIKIGLASIINRLGKGLPVSIEQAERLEAIADSTFEAVHRISSDLRPNILELGIVAALEWQCEEFQKQIDIACEFTCKQHDIHVTNAQAITLFRICQESMSNIAKHAQASHASVELSANINEIIMTISDDGVGIKSSDTLKANSFGLRGMQERVAALEGSFNISKSSKPGTHITVKLPIEHAE
ncbi:MAG TPA: histidine kinase [Methylophilaceae bacterium]|nr:histidine kinase [Methylophilaceae bacterium]